MSPRARERAANFALLSVSLLCALVVGEGLLRLVGFEYAPLDVRAEAADAQRPDEIFDDASFVFDTESIWAPRSGHGVFNSQGFRGPLLEMPKPEGQIRILAVGDSNTLGWAGRHGSNWPALLEAELAQRARQVVVVNAGVWGYSSFQGLQRLRQCLSYRPDLILVSFGSNDAHAAAWSDRDFAARHGGSGGLASRIARWRWGQLWLALGDRLFRPSSAATHRVPLAEYRRNLASMIGLARKQQARAVLLTRPFIGESDHADWWKVRGADYNAATVLSAAEHQAPLIDVYSHFKTRAELFADESHFTDAGHRRAAALIARELLPHLE